MLIIFSAIVAQGTVTDVLQVLQFPPYLASLFCLDEVTEVLAPDIYCMELTA